MVPGACGQPVSLGNGFERCANGMLHRADVGGAECSSELPRARALDDAALAEIERVAQQTGVPLSAMLESLPCREDGDCTASPNGHCMVASGLGETSLTWCRYGCTRDADCGETAVCMCGSPVGACVYATCQSDRDCGGELRCTQHEEYGDCTPLSTVTFACQTAADECIVDADCGGDTPYCKPTDGKRICTSGTGCPPIGRPFIVEDQLRVAEPAARDDWTIRELSKEAVPRLVREQPALERELAEAWAELGLMEHASVASFARFALQLASLGAPPELLQGAASAMRDEIQHAQACFALASRYAGKDVGPGRLNVQDALGGMELDDIVVTAINEGCIGETVAALEALEAAEHCIDEPARRALERIARDEARHAQLAWQFVAWALGSSAFSPSALVERVRCTFQAALESPRAGGASSSRRERALLEFGIVGPARREALRQCALREVIWPCAEVLLRSMTEAGPPRAPSMSVALGTPQRGLGRGHTRDGHAEG